MANNIYSEMLEGLKIPERLSPENIAAMLDAKMLEQNNRAKISLSSAPENNISDSDNNVPADKQITVSGGKNRSLGFAYRTVASLAACAVMAFGLVRYFDSGEIQSVDSDIKGSTFATDYDEIHKTFRKYYVDDENKKTLDSVVAEIAPSYDDSQFDSTGDNAVSEPDVPLETTKPDDTVTAPPIADNDPTPENPTPVPDDTTTENPSFGSDVRLPEFDFSEDNENVLIGDGRIFVRDGSTVKVVLTNGGKMEYIGDAVPEYGLFETKTLEEIYTVDSRLIAIYSVVKEEPASVPAAAEQEQSIVGEMINNIYTDNSLSVKTNSVEIVVYDTYPNGMITAASVTSLKGTLTESRLKDGYVYVVTNYNNYRHSPLIGVEDLDGYVPSYTVNGEKCYVQPENILIPEYVATTDYTVISGIAAALPNVPVSVQAVLGTEDKVLVTDSAVYVFGYSNSQGTQSTTIEKFSLNYGIAHFDGSALVEGVAVKNGIAEDNGIIIVTTLKNTELGYVTSANVLDGNMNLVSKADFPAALKNVSFNKRKVFLSNSSEGYAVDFTSPSTPVQIEYQDDIDITSGLVEFSNGYCTLTKGDNGEIILAKLARNANDELYTECETVVYQSGGSSKALKDNRLLYCDGANGYIGVPYGYYDGFDYCYKYALYKLEPQGFVKVGEIESHEVDESFEMGKAVLNNGVLYIFSEGRIYSAAVGENALSVIGRADLIESSYSGHTDW